MSSEPDPRDPNGPVAPLAHFTTDAANRCFQVSVATHLAANPQFDAVAVGALVFRTSPLQDSPRELLLIQRADNEFFPSKWEIPGGACDLEDCTILHGLARELWEESKLKLVHVRQQVGLGGTAELAPSVKGAAFRTPGGVRVIKYSFIVDAVDLGNIILNPTEHQKYLWITENEFQQRCSADAKLEFTTEQQIATIAEAFRLLSG
ncbi:hypothetical protein K4F52_001488 [Lecanicillium sp. MT-2017a]|nr:hypothetical protein K4F52_001488 [Lecanicillium sp. MT-2017a]